MITENDSAIVQHFIEVWEAELKDYLTTLGSQIISRRIFPVRTIGADAMFDNVTTYDRVGPGAKIVAKGSIPGVSGSKASYVPHMMYQFLDSIMLTDKDLKLDPKLKTREVEIMTDNLHKLENHVAVSGDVEHNIPGITTSIPGASQLKTLGKWDGSGSAVKFYKDVLRMKQKMNKDFRPAFLIGNATTLGYLEDLTPIGEVPYWTKIASLFVHTSQENPLDTWMVQTDDDTLPAGKVYMAPYNKKAAECVVSENLSLRPIPLQRGGNYPVEGYEWLTFEKHKVDAFVELDTTTE